MSILISRRFGPLFAAQAIGAFNDNMFKNALVVLLLFGAAGEWSGVLVAFSGALFVAPYIFLGAWSGALADSSERSSLVRKTKILEVTLMAIGVLGFYLDSILLLMSVLFGLGIQSTLFSPMKYSLLPDHLKADELVLGNGWLEAGTFGGILLGTIAGGGLMAAGFAGWQIAGFGLVLSIVGYLFSTLIPSAPIASHAAIPSPFSGAVRRTMALLGEARGDKMIWHCILGIGWFWTVGAIVLTAFPVMVREEIGAGAGAITLMLAIFAIGTAIGSIMAHKISRNKASGHLSALSLLGIAVFAIDFSLAARSSPSFAWETFNISGFRMLVDLMFLAIAGGILSVPLYAMMQERAKEGRRSSIVAANNIMNAVMMVAGAIVFALLHALGMGASIILTWTGIVTLMTVPMAFYAWPPREMMKKIFRGYFRFFHKVQIRGLENIPSEGRIMFTPNHISFADGVLIASHLPKGMDPLFAVFTGTVSHSLMRPFLSMVDVLPIEPARPQTLRGMVKALREKRPLVIFPEGRLTVTGGLMKIYDGSAVAAHASDATIIPVRIDGFEGHPLSRTGHLFPRRWFPKITLTFLPPEKLTAPKGVRPRVRRAALGNGLRAIMEKAAALGRPTGGNLWSAMLDSMDRNGQERLAEEADRVALTPKKLRVGVHAIGHLLLRDGMRDLRKERIGLLLPNTRAAVVAFWTVQAWNGVCAMLNFSAGSTALISATRTAEVKRILTARAFVKKANLQDRILELENHGLEILYLEDIGKKIGFREKFKGIFNNPRKLPGCLTALESAAVILFTSGSEGEPKGVMLSHKNILTNTNQMRALFDFTPADRVLNAMPVFHAFGLVGGTILPMLCGTRLLLHPSPLHFRMIPELCYDMQATIIFATDTFLGGWARSANPRDFGSVRLAFAGAERLRPETVRLYSEKFGVRVLEGYGATECSPVISVNTPADHRAGTVGRLMPGMSYRIEEIPGLPRPEDMKENNCFGRLFVGGNNVMMGYIMPNKPGVLVPPTECMHDTGDVVTIDSEGFLTIRGRVKRFAKIAGEMVPMGNGEEIAHILRPANRHAVDRVADPKKGERLILLTDSDVSVAELLAEARKKGIPELFVPRDIIRGEVPLLPTGKVDYPSVAKILAS